MENLPKLQCIVLNYQNSGYYMYNIDYLNYDTPFRFRFSEVVIWVIVFLWVDWLLSLERRPMGDISSKWQSPRETLWPWFLINLKWSHSLNPFLNIRYLYISNVTYCHTPFRRRCNVNCILLFKIYFHLFLSQLRIFILWHAL